MNIEELRNEIDRLDAEIVRLINRRAQVVMRVGELKRKQDATIYVPSREQRVFQHVSQCSEGPLPEESVVSVFREIISACRALEHKVRVAFLGPLGTFSHRAARTVFGSSVEFVPVPAMDAIFDEVEKRRADYGVVPVENSSQGGIHDTLRRFIDSDLTVCGELTLAIHHYLMAHCDMADIKTVYSKETVFIQCRKWLTNNLGHIEWLPAASTAEAAAIAAREDGAAAIAGFESAGMNDLRILAERIEDDSENHTRFFVLGRQATEPTGKDKTSLLCSVQDRPGALCNLLTELKNADINMTKIESFPSPKAAFQYYFFIDILGHSKEEPIAAALEKARGHCVEFKVLGAFPRG
ncbi:MAG TPA: prephenate dehydratase [Candidatus Brocadiia bacterium]|nr:prephenate dehydratase [Candidatus Brocadiia bacterium]